MKYEKPKITTFYRYFRHRILHIQIVFRKLESSEYIDYIKYITFIFLKVK